MNAGAGELLLASLSTQVSPQKRARMRASSMALRFPPKTQCHVTPLGSDMPLRPAPRLVLCRFGLAAIAEDSTPAHSPRPLRRRHAPVGEVSLGGVSVLQPSSQEKAVRPREMTRCRMFLHEDGDGREGSRRGGSGGKGREGTGLLDALSLRGLSLSRSSSVLVVATFFVPSPP